MPRHTFRKTEAGRYILQTGQSPAQCRNLLFVVWQGPLDNLQEKIVGARELHNSNSVSPAKVPLDWYNALAEASCLFVPREPPPPYQESEPVYEPLSPPEPAGRVPSMFKWGPYWVLLAAVIAFSFILGVSQ